jgi:uncharacterized membrane protein
MHGRVRLYRVGSAFAVGLHVFFMPPRTASCVHYAARDVLRMDERMLLLFGISGLIVPILCLMCPVSGNWS